MLRAVVFFLMSLFGASLWAANYAPVTVPMVLVQVSPHTYFVQGLPGTAIDFEGFISNAGAIITDEGIVMIDSLGTPALASHLRNLLRKVSDKPVIKVITTHYHADHILGLQVFKDEGAEIIAPRGANDYLNSPLAMERLEERRFSLDPWVNEQTRLVAPDRIIEEDTSLTIGGVTLNLSLLGNAHSDGDMAVFVEPDNVLYSGDIIFEGRIPFVGSANTRNWLKALDKMRRTRVAALIPGHGGLAKRPNEAVAATYDYITYLREQLGSAVADFTPFDDAYTTIDWSRFSDLPAFEAGNRRNAYQVYLSLEAESFAK